jgi:hypothetical protein
MWRISLLATRWVWDALPIAVEAAIHATWATNIIVKKDLRLASTVEIARAE